jgi:hypothetical protein
MTRRKPAQKPPGIPAIAWSSRQSPAVPLDPDRLYTIEETVDPLQVLLHPLPLRPERDPTVKHDLSISLYAYGLLSKKMRRGESVRKCLERLILEAPDAVEPRKPDPAPGRQFA